MFPKHGRAKIGRMGKKPCRLRKNMHRLLLTTIDIAPSSNHFSLSCLSLIERVQGG